MVCVQQLLGLGAVFVFTGGHSGFIEYRQRLGHDFLQERLLALRDSRITSDGVLILKAQQYRTQEANRADALERLVELILSATKVEKKRRPTKPTLGSKKRRLDTKSKRANIKAGRGKVDF